MKKGLKWVKRSQFTEVEEKIWGKTSRFWLKRKKFAQTPPFIPKKVREFGGKISQFGLKRGRFGPMSQFMPKKGKKNGGKIHIFG